MTGSSLLTWLGERMRDASMWPINLVRDFPVRSRRLLRTIWDGVLGVAGAVPGIARAVRNGQLRPWLRRASLSVAGWVHLFLVHLFDLFGGPEVCQFLAHLITTTTPLDDGEIDIIRSVLGAEQMRYRDVRIAEGGLLEFVFRVNGNLAFTTWHTIHLPTQSPGGRTDHTRANRNILVHELTHVLQYERVGSRYLGEAIYELVRTKRNCYDYGFIQGLRDADNAGKRYCDFNREQQAQIVQDYFMLKCERADVTAYEPFMIQLRGGEL